MAAIAPMTDDEILAEMLEEARFGLGSGAAEHWADLGDAGRRFPLSLHLLMGRNGVDFLAFAWKELLGRAPDEAELGVYAPALASARLTKTEILGQIRFSPEGERMGRNVPGLKHRYDLQRAYRIPVLGRLLRVGSAILLLPRALRDMQRLEQSAHADRQRLEAVEQAAAAAGPVLSARVNQMEARLADIERIERRLAELERQGPGKRPG